MILNKNKIKIGFTDLLLLAATIVYYIGMTKWFLGCNNTTMPCHWASEVLKAIGILAICIAIVHVIFPNALVKVGMDISFVGLFILAFIIPGNVINLCKLSHMSCREHLKPGNMILSIVVIVAAVIDLCFYLLQNSKEKHKRKM